MVLNHKHVVISISFLVFGELSQVGMEQTLISRQWGAQCNQWGTAQ